MHNLSFSVYVIVFNCSLFLCNAVSLISKLFVCNFFVIMYSDDCCSKHCAVKKIMIF